jgi:predicted GNAT superfamily acetyltransferase
MMATGIDIGLATHGDVDGILDLQERNLRKNGGALSVPMSRAWLEAALPRMPIVVARRNRQIIGFVVSSALEDQSDDPVLNGMLAAYSAAPGAYVYGPICVADSERGKGVARAMFDNLRACLKGREGFTFIRADNTVSRKVHVSMGMREAATFRVAGVDFVVVAYDG